MNQTTLDQLAHYLATHGMTLDRQAGAVLLAGGLANRNYRIVLDGSPCVLRRPPDGDLPPGAHDMAREHRVLSRLYQAFPLAPQSRHFCADRAVIGVPFQIIEHRAGLIIRGDRLPSDAGPDAGETLSAMLVATLAALHQVDPAAIGLDTLGRPEGFAARAAAGWVGRAAGTGSSHAAALAAELGDWLNAHLPRPAPPRLLHCDFKLDNIFLDPATLAPTAVLDWDMCTRGDALFDLATLLSYWAEPGDPDCMQRLAQMPTSRHEFPRREAIVARYAATSGQDVSDYFFFRVLAVLKLGVVFVQLHERWPDDPVYADFDALGIDLLLFARDIAQGSAA